MAGVKLGKLPDRTPIKFTITVTPDLARALGEYAEAYEAAYGKRQEIVELVPAMLRIFLESDRAFARRTRIKPTRI